MPDTTVGAALDHAALASRPPGDRLLGLRFLTTSVDDADAHPWHDLRDRALRVAGALVRLGVAPGERVATVLPTAPSFFDAFFGALLAGAVPVPLYPPVRLGRIDEYVHRTAAMLRASGAAAVISDTRIRRLLGQVDAACPTRLGLRDVDTLRQQGPALTEPLPTQPDDLALVQFSSGTTGTPRPVALTHRAVLANARAVLDQIEAVTPLDGDPPAHGVSWLPLYHDMGLIGCVLPALLGPAALTLIPPERFLARPSLWLQAISRYGGTVSPAPDFAYALCAERVRDEELAGVDLSTWRMALNGAEPVSAATHAAFVDRFAPFGFSPGAYQPVYGLSEMALAVCFTPTGRGPRFLSLRRDALAEGRAEPAPEGADDEAVVRRVTCGPPLPGFGVRIRGDDGTLAPAGHVGEVEVSGPSRMEGYLGHPTQPFTEDGWLRTGDAGLLTDDGELVLTGRRKDLIILRGRNHDPHDLEVAASGVDGVRTGCVAAVADLSGDGERVVVLAESRAPIPNPEDDLADTVARAIRAATGLSPDLVVVLAPGTLPRTSSGKIRRAEARERWQAGTLVPPDAVTARHLAGALAHSALGRLQAAWKRARR